MTTQTGGIRSGPATKLVGTIAMFMLPAQQVLVFVFLVIEPDRPLSDADSLYALGEFGWLWRAGAVVSGLGVLALALGLTASLAPGKRVKAAISTLVLGGLALMATGVFPTDPPLEDGTVGYTTAGVLHFVFGILGLVTLLVAVFLLQGVFKRDRRSSYASRPTRWLAWWLLAGVVLLLALPENTIPAGVVQRVVFIPEAIWGVWLAWRIRLAEPRRQGPIGRLEVGARPPHP